MNVPLRDPFSNSALFLAAAVMGCAFGLMHSGSKPTPEMIPHAKAAERAAAPDELDQLLRARYETAKALLDLEEKRLEEGATTLGRVCEAGRWVRDSAAELPVSPEERLRALTNYLDLTRRLEDNVARASAQGAAPPSDRESARYLRLDAQIALLRFQLQNRK